VLNVAFSIRPISPEVLASSVIADPGLVVPAVADGDGMTRTQNRHHGTPSRRRDTIPGTASDACVATRRGIRSQFSQVRPGER
jgi:hypothetical protein